MKIVSTSQFYALEIPEVAQELSPRPDNPDEFLFDISASTLNTWLKRLSELTGLGLSLTNYIFRRGAAEAFNLSGARIFFQAVTIEICGS
jgi:hypothetical protein